MAKIYYAQQLLWLYKATQTETLTGKDFRSTFCVPVLCAGFWAHAFFPSHFSCILFSILSGTFPSGLPNWHIVNLPGVLLSPVPRRHSCQWSSKHEGSVRRWVEGEGNGYQAYIINLSCRCLSRECRKSLVALHTVRKAEIYSTHKKVNLAPLRKPEITR